RSRRSGRHEACPSRPWHHATECGEQRPISTGQRLGRGLALEESVSSKDTRTWVVLKAALHGDSVATMATFAVRSRSLDVRSSVCFRSTMRPDRTAANGRERPLRIDKLGVTGSSPVPPITESSGNRVFVLPEPRTRFEACSQNARKIDRLPGN